eukprot:3146497-Rhodomonas_salina.4
MYDMVAMGMMTEEAYQDAVEQKRSAGLPPSILALLPFMLTLPPFMLALPPFMLAILPYLGWRCSLTLLPLLRLTFMAAAAAQAGNVVIGAGRPYTSIHADDASIFGGNTLLLLPAMHPFLVAIPTIMLVLRLFWR